MFDWLLGTKVAYAIFNTDVATGTVTGPLSAGITNILGWVQDSIATFWGYAFLILIVLWLFRKAYQLFGLR